MHTVMSERKINCAFFGCQLCVLYSIQYSRTGGLCTIYSCLIIISTYQRVVLRNSSKFAKFIPVLKLIELKSTLSEDSYCRPIDKQLIRT